LVPMSEAIKYSIVVGARLFRKHDTKNRKRRLVGDDQVKDSGLARRPIKKASEKFKVAKDDRNMPIRSKDIHLASRYCWRDGLQYRAMSRDKICGRTELTTLKAKNRGARALAGPWLNMYKGITPIAWQPITRHRGRNSRLSWLIGEAEDGGDFRSEDGALDLVIEYVDWPLFTQMCRAMIVKFAASNMALGK
jgi:hypothetical protein